MISNQPNILFVDNDSKFLETTKILLEIKGYKIDAVTSIEWSLQKLKRNRYDIAIIDLKMPGLVEPVWGGMDAISTFIKIDPLIQIIVLMGYGSEEHKIEAINRGAFDFVEKSNQFIEAIKNTVEYAYASRRSIFSRNALMKYHFSENIAKFVEDHPYEKNVFIMMRYYDGIDVFENIEKYIKETLNRFGFKGHLAKDKEYSDDLWDNIRVYMHACKYGIAVFEQIKDSDFNPNKLNNFIFGVVIGLFKDVPRSTQ